MTTTDITVQPQDPFLLTPIPDNPESAVLCAWRAAAERALGGRFPVALKAMVRRLDSTAQGWAAATAELGSSSPWEDIDEVTAQLARVGLVWDRRLRPGPLRGREVITPRISPEVVDIVEDQVRTWEVSVAALPADQQTHWAYMLGCGRAALKAAEMAVAE